MLPPERPGEASIRASPDIHVTDGCEITVSTRAEVVYVEGDVWQPGIQLI